jgi:hypothetical protein
MEAKHRNVLDAIRGGAWSDAEIGTIEAVAKEIIPAYAG